MAMRTALLIPEIVELIVQSGEAPRGFLDFLFTCLRINKTFSLAACRLLWCAVIPIPQLHVKYVLTKSTRRECGVRRSGEPCVPNIQHLTEIIQRSPRRGQFYASFLRIFHIHRRDFSWRTRDETKWQAALKAVKFDKLIDLWCDGLFGARMFKRDGGGALHHPLPRFRSFKLDGRPPLWGENVEFLDLLSKNCKLLETLEVRLSRIGNVPMGSLAQFIEKATFLKFITIDNRKLGEIWSKEPFSALV